MRPLLLLSAIAAAIALTVFGLRARDTPAPSDVNATGRGVDRSPIEGSAGQEQGSSPSPLTAPSNPDSTPRGQADTDKERIPVVTIPTAPVRSFHGAALIQREGELLSQAESGTIELDAVYRGARKRFIGTIEQGRFAIDVPRVARLVLVGGQFDGDEVHFDDPKGPFDPTDDDYALIGVVTPSYRLIVQDGGQRSPLRDVVVRRADDATSATMGDIKASGEVVLDDGTSPIKLPHIDVRRPVWLAVTAPGYAATHVMVDPRKTGEKTVNLWPSADLSIKVTGKGRGRLRVLLLTRDEGNGVTPHAGTFGISSPGVKTNPSDITFPLKGLAGIPHTIRAKGYDRRGVTVDLGEPLHVDLGPNDGRTIEFRID